MRVGRKIALVGGVPILIAGAIALAGWLLLAQEERARGGAILAERIYQELAVAPVVRDAYVAAAAPEREAVSERFAGLTAQAGRSLQALKGFARTRDQTARIGSTQDALTRYRTRMAEFARLTRDNDGLIREMARRTDALTDLADRARLRQQAGNADLVRSLGAGVDGLGLGRDVSAALHALRAIVTEIALERARAGLPASQALPAQRMRLRTASRNLAGALRADGREREAGELEALAAADDALGAGAAGDANASETAIGARLAEWAERILAIDASGHGPCTMRWPGS